MENDGVAVLTYIEFYSGIGGWSLALEKACRDIVTDVNVNMSVVGDGVVAEASDVTAASSTSRSSSSSRRKRRVEVKRLASYDHSDLCNSVFAHNFIKDDDDDSAARTSTCSQSTNDPRSNKSNERRKKKKHNNHSSSSTPTVRRPPPAASLPSYPIEKLTVDDLAQLNGDIWAMSPPCQPHTRQHDKHTAKDELSDPRSKSFLHLIQLLQQLSSNTMPKIILLENVIGFEESVSCGTYKSALMDCGYAFVEYHLTPNQVGISNDRPRYYCVAVRRQDCTSMHNANIIGKDKVARSLMSMLQDSQQMGQSSVRTSILPLKIVGPDSAASEAATCSLPTIASYLDNDLPPLATDASNINTAKLAALEISKSTIAKSASWCFDIITQKDSRSACFTSSYGKYFRGTGSVLYYGQDEVETVTREGASGTSSSIGTNKDTADLFRLVAPEERAYDAKWWERLVAGQDEHSSTPPLRYLSGTEVARLMGFPLKKEGRDETGTAFAFPDWCTERQMWRLLGNSINVAVSARVVEAAMRIYLEGDDCD